jgi:putative membrane protein
MNSSSDTANYGTHDNQSVARSDANAGAGPQLNDGSDKTKIAAALSDQDRNFMQDAGAGGMYEVQAGEKALAKSSDQRVKNIAQHMVDDHTKANQQLMALARRKGVELAGVPNADQIKMLAQLDKLNGTDFDQEYINQQKQAHQDTIAKFQTEASDGKDRDTRDWAASTLPTLREHLNMINGTTENGLGSNR